MPGKQYDVAAPIELPSGKTIWLNVGKAFEGEDTKYHIKAVVSSIPVTVFGGESLELFLFECKDRHQQKTQEPRSSKPYPPMDDDRDTGGGPPFDGEDEPF